MKLSLPAFVSLAALLGGAQGNMDFSSATLTQIEETAGQRWADIVVRENGNFIATRIDAPEIWSIDPITGKGRLLVTVPDVTGVSGIVEMRPNVFVFAAANFFNGTLGPASAAPGSARLYEVDLSASEAQPKINGVIMLPEGAVPSGLTRKGDREVLVADIAQGQMYRVEIRNGTAAVRR